MLDGVDYPDDLGVSVPFDEFYRRMAEGSDTRTSQVNVSEYVEYFTPFLEAGKDVLHVSLSGGLSGTVNAARNAASILGERFPERKIYVVDSLGASSGYGLLMDKAADLRDDGMSIDELRDWLEAHKLDVHHWFFSTDLTFYIKGRRIVKTAGFIGTILGICPLLNMDDKGRRPRKRSARKKPRSFRSWTRWSSLPRAGWTTAASATSANPPAWRTPKPSPRCWKRFPHLNGKVEINSIGTTIGSHTGPGTVALFFFGTPRQD